MRHDTSYQNPAPETPATKFLHKHGVAHSNPLYEYEEHGGTSVSARELNVPEGIVGRHPKIESLIFATGFSGHGIQQSPAVGRAVAELIVHGDYRTLDLNTFGYDRIESGRPIRELNVV